MNRPEAGSSRKLADRRAAGPGAGGEGGGQLSGAFDRPIDRLDRVLDHTSPASPAGLGALARTHRDQAEFTSADARQALDYSAQSGSVAGLEVGRVDLGLARPTRSAGSGAPRRSRSPADRV